MAALAPKSALRSLLARTSSKACHPTSAALSSRSFASTSRSSLPSSFLPSARPRARVSDFARRAWGASRSISLPAAEASSTPAPAAAATIPEEFVPEAAAAAPIPPLPSADPALLTESLPADSLPLETSAFEHSITGANDLLINTGSIDLSSLASSWAPHPIMRLQSMFLQLHESFPFLSGGLPWYFLIPIITIALRVLLFSFQVRAQSNAARMAIIQPQMLSGMAKVKAAKERKDSMGAHAAQIEVQTLMSKHNVNPIRNLAFPLAQATVFMTMFFAIKGIATAGIPSMALEGFSWVPDLTAPDPYWALPVASTALTLATLELGVDSSTQVQTTTTKNMKLFFRIMLCVALPFIAYFPAAVLVYWVTNNSVSLLQSLLLKQPSIRSFFNIPTPPPKIQPGEKGYIPEPSFAEAFRNVQVGMADKWEETKEKGEKEAMRRKAFEEGAEVVRTEGVYAPRAPMKKRAGRVEETARALGKTGLLETSGSRGEIVAAALSRKEREKTQRVLQARQRRKKN